MDKIRYYMDEHVAKAVIRGLRERGVDVMSVVDADMLGAMDQEHLEFAFREHRVLRFTPSGNYSYQRCGQYLRQSLCQAGAWRSQKERQAPAWLLDGMFFIGYHLITLFQIGW